MLRPTLATEYQRLVQESRRRVLRQDRELVRRLERLLAEAAGRMADGIGRVPRGIQSERWRRQVLAGIDAELASYREAYKDLLDGELMAAARAAEARERETLDLLLRSRWEMAPEQRVITTVEAGRMQDLWGTVPRATVERLYARVGRDGLNLSQRLYAYHRRTAIQCAEFTVQAVQTGQGPRELARTIRRYFEAGGVDNARYRAMRIARTEIPTAGREAHVATVTDEEGNLRGYCRGIGWRLSPRHPVPDICDVWASQDIDGLGPGNYLPAHVPADHPHGFCYTTTLLAALPRHEFPGKRPRPDAVPDAQRRYYGIPVEGE